MKILCIIIISIFLLSCEKKNQMEIGRDNHSITVTDSTVIDGVKLKLIDSSGVGKLITDSNKYRISGKIKIKTPCYFLRDRNNKVTSFSYSDIGVKHTLAIVGDILNNEEKSHYSSFSKDEIWGLKVQGILFKNDIFLTDRIVFGGPFCVNIGLDEKDYWSFAHD